MEYQSKELAARWQIHAETLRQWSIEYARHLSDTASPEKPKSHRKYTFEDVEVLQLVADMRGKNKSAQEIHEALDRGDRGVPEVDPAALIPLEGQKQLAMLYSTIETLRADKYALEDELRARHDEITRLTALLDRSDKQNDDLQAKVDRLVGELAVLKANKPRMDD